MRRLSRNVVSEMDHQSSTSHSERKLEFSLRRMVCIFVTSLVVLCVYVVLNDVVLETPGTWFLRLRPNDDKAIDSKVKKSEAVMDKLLNGLIVAGFDESVCRSRYESSFYHKGLLQKPPSYLVLRLRKYEALHKKCGPYTDLYNKSVERIKAGQGGEGSASECNYVVWIAYSGLGNRILTLASAFLYALLTERVLLVDRGENIMNELLCEPFPGGVSWFLPKDFPLTNQFSRFHKKATESYANFLNDRDVANILELRAYLYLHLSYDYGFHDKLFFCEQDQAFLRNIPWLVMRSDNYFVPSLFLIPSFEQELGNLFPDKDLVFHFLGRYLFHPTNRVWGLITRYYKTYLANADERVGIQIRVFDEQKRLFQQILDNILACTLKENLLPEINNNKSAMSLSKTSKPKAVLLTSLSAGYYEKIRDMYWEHPTANGDLIGVFQPSHEELQQSNKLTHNQKALAEMFLLSMTDVLVTTSWSTFGYVAQSLAGLRPWILVKPDNQTVTDPPCRRAMSIEPCFHSPPYYDCKAKRDVDPGKLVPHVRHCEDRSEGLKLVNHYDDM